MQTTTCLRLALALITGAGLAPLQGADHTKTNDERYALTYAQQNPDDTGLEAYLKSLGLAKGKHHDAVVSLVSRIRAALADEIEPDSIAFWDAVAGPAADKTPAPAIAATPRAATAPPPDKTAATGGGTAAPAATDTTPATKHDVTTIIQKALAADKEPKANFQNYQAFFHVGVNLLNPYKITPLAASPTRKEIAAATDTQVGGFLEFTYTNRWAWNQDRIKRTFLDTTCPRYWPTLTGEEKENKTDFEQLKARKDKAYAQRDEQFRSILGKDRKELLKQWDVQFRLGYNFAKSSELTANTLVGASDINAELDFAMPLVADDFVDGAFTVGPEISYAATTSKNTFDVHQRLFAGIAYSTSFVSPFDDDKQRRVMVHARVGYARLANVRFVDETSREIVTFHDGTPRFFPDSAFAFEAELLYPIRSYTFLTLGARIYGSQVPNPWNLYFGLTTPISSLADGLFPK